MKILSIDGGGIRGLIPAIILTELENQTGKKTSDLFDLVVGTSTGGLLGLLLTTDFREYKASELQGVYSRRGSDIFARPTWRKWKALDIVEKLVGDALYKHGSLESVLLEYLGDSKMGDAKIPIMVTAYDMHMRSTVFIKSWKQKHANFLMRECARATSAAPTYFEPANVSNSPPD